MAYLSVNGRELRHYTKQVKSRVGERFIHEAYSFMSVSFYTYLCIHVGLYLQLRIPLHDINSVALERVFRATLAELSKNLLVSLSLRNRIILSKLEVLIEKASAAVSCHANRTKTVCRTVEHMNFFSLKSIT